MVMAHFSWTNLSGSDFAMESRRIISRFCSILYDANRGSSRPGNEGEDEEEYHILSEVSPSGPSLTMRDRARVVEIPR